MCWWAGLPARAGGGQGQHQGHFACWRCRSPATRGQHSMFAGLMAGLCAGPSPTPCLPIPAPACPAVQHLMAPPTPSPQMHAGLVHGGHRGRRHLLLPALRRRARGAARRHHRVPLLGHGLRRHRGRQQGGCEDHRLAGGHERAGAGGGEEDGGKRPPCRGGAGGGRAAGVGGGGQRLPLADGPTPGQRLGAALRHSCPVGNAPVSRAAWVLGGRSREGVRKSGLRRERQALHRPMPAGRGPPQPSSSPP